MSCTPTGIGNLPAICVAMPEELAPFLTDDAVSEQVGGARFIQTEIGGQSVLLVASGIGLVNAAMGATLAIAQFGATALISAGSAGGVAPQVRVGDVVVASETCYSTADATAFGTYSLGQIPQMPAKYVSNIQMCDAVESNAQIHRGQIISGDAFVWESNYADYVGKFPRALATDMETAALAQVAYQFGVPWVSVRAISDLCGPSAAGDFRTHINNAATISAVAVMAMLANFANHLS